MLHRDIIPDIHADFERLQRTLSALDGGASLAFLGDFIDAGKKVANPNDKAVLKKVRTLIEEEEAIAVMGNHELNAILFHRTGTDGASLRAHTVKNTAQHRSFCQTFGIGTKDALDWTDWFLELPLWHEQDGLRLVHACWSEPDINIIKARRCDGRLKAEDLMEVAAKVTPFAKAVDTLLTGPECPLPEGYRFHIGEDVRYQVRIAWWRSQAKTWREAALSVPDHSELPDARLPDDCRRGFYPEGEFPVCVGHYKMGGDPKVETTQAACLDYPDTACAYHWRGEAKLHRDNLLKI